MAEAMRNADVRVGGCRRRGSMILAGIGAAAVLAAAANREARCRRNAAHHGAAQRRPSLTSPEQAAGLLNGLEGVEMDDAVVPDQRPGRAAGSFIRIPSLQAAWGRSSERFPPARTTPPSRRCRSPSRTAGRSRPCARPASTADGRVRHRLRVERAEPHGCAQAGNRRGERSARLKLSIGNFSSKLLRDDPVEREQAAKALEVGAIELAVHDAGAVDLTVARLAREQAITPGDARAKMIADMRRGARTQPRQSSECQRLVDALGRFLAKDGETL